MRKEINRYPCECGHLEKDHAMDMEEGCCWNCKTLSAERPYIIYGCTKYRIDNLKYLEIRNEEKA